MAYAKNNKLVEGWSGKLANLLFRQRNGKTFISMAPAMPTGERSSWQKDNSNKFQIACAYARLVKNDVVLWEMYRSARQGNQTATNVAIKDFYTAPEIQSVLLPPPGSQSLLVKVTDIIRVYEVEISIIYNSLEAPEIGTATYAGTGDQWVYNILSTQLLQPGSRICVRARDFPGNTTLREITL